jgi:hypothetical protein
MAIVKGTAPFAGDHAMSASHRSAGNPIGGCRADMTKQSLSEEQQRLLQLLQRIRYGRILRLRVCDGQPVVDRAVVWTRTVKVRGDNTPHPNSRCEDFALRRDVVEFFQLLVELGDGEITNLEIRNGLPFTFEVNESFAD